MLNTFLGSNVSSEKCANTLSLIFQSTRTTWSDQWDLYLFYFPAYCPLAWSRSTRRMENQWETQMVSASDVSQVTTQTTAISGIRLFLGKQFFYFLWIISGEPGEFVGEIVRNHPARDFHGYADKTATAKKILNDVWRKGDTCFRRYMNLNI